MDMTGAVVLLAAIGIVGFLIWCNLKEKEWNSQLTPLQRWKLDHDEREQDRIW